MVPKTYDRVLGRLEGWVLKNSTWLALGVIVAALVLGLAYAGSCYLNPDEAFLFDAARPHSWRGAFEASRTTAHPPLFVLVLHAILYLGRSELILRLPSIGAGTVALWLIFAWVRRSLGEMAALGALGFVALTPAAISASTEARQYGLLLCFICGALYATERSLTERSTFWAIVQGSCLLGAILTHYTAIVLIPPRWPSMFCSARFCTGYPGVSSSRWVRFRLSWPLYWLGCISSTLPGRSRLVPAEAWTIFSISTMQRDTSRCSASLGGRSPGLSCT